MTEKYDIFASGDSFANAVFPPYLRGLGTRDTHKYAKYVNHPSDPAAGE